MSSTFPCTECQADTRVLDSRATAGGVRRRRTCIAGHRFTTYEMPTEKFNHEVSIRITTAMHDGDVVFNIETVQAKAPEPVS